MRRQLLPALGMIIVFTVITGLLYPLVVTGVGQTAFGEKADGSLIESDGTIVGSSLIGQPFVDADYFHPRPSAVDYSPGPEYSAGSNYGPTNPALIGDCEPVPVTDEEGNELTDEAGDPVIELNDDGTIVCDPNTVPQRVAAYRTENGLDDDVEVPVDAVTASASGLDPHISVANARLQAARVADERDLDETLVFELIDEHTQGRGLGFLGEPGVNVVELNLALDAQR